MNTHIFSVLFERTFVHVNEMCVCYVCVCLRRPHNILIAFDSAIALNENTEHTYIDRTQTDRF